VLSSSGRRWMRENAATPRRSLAYASRRLFDEGFRGRFPFERWFQAIEIRDRIKVSFWQFDDLAVLSARLRAES